MPSSVISIELLMDDFHSSVAIVNVLFQCCYSV